MTSAWTVAEITARIRLLLEGDAELQDVDVSGEISNLTRARSGHWYFTLKDASASLRCVMWRSAAARQRFLPQEGDAVQALGHIGVYEPRGEYQLYATALRPLGVGDLYARFEALKAALEAEGLFDPDRKRALPAFPRVIGVVTSPQAAAFQDVCNVLRRRFPLAQVWLSPAAVQGLEAPAQLRAALARLNAEEEVDVILLIRGGGSIEDLWAFNDEALARAIVASRLPLVSGVGHETDFTIADFVADLRAPTPSAAAELVAPDLAELDQTIGLARARLTELQRGRLAQLQGCLDSGRRNLALLSPQRELATQRQRLDDQELRLQRAWAGAQGRLAARLAQARAALGAADPRAILQRGYAILTQAGDGKRVTGVKEAQVGDALLAQLRDGDLPLRVEDRDKHERYGRTLF
ncbi:MAG: exodeoxyribonuclease VII large subunit [Anaerolineaceae bacterium]|nr:exodeoxyribonuclease VII large subunit [Anaerolineaceae bacterium]MDE0330111.1 exodeoxyribonuclease VII large subunit [Anaerolineaceae bacterium]